MSKKLCDYKKINTYKLTCATQVPCSANCFNNNCPNDKSFSSNIESSSCKIFPFSDMIDVRRKSILSFYRLLLKNIQT